MLDQKLVPVTKHGETQTRKGFSATAATKQKHAAKTGERMMRRPISLHKDLATLQYRMLHALDLPVIILVALI